MAEVRLGRLEPMAELFERHRGRLFGFFLRLTGRPSLSEDLVQELFLRMLKYRTSFRPGSPFGPWMFRIAHRLHLDHRTGAPGAEDPTEWLESYPDPGPDPRSEVERQSEQALLERALARLEPRKRELLLLSRQPDLPYQAVANLLDCSVASVKVQVHRALKELREAYAAVQGGAP